MATVKVKFSADFDGYQPNEEAAFDSARAVELVGRRLATYSDSGDATTYADQVAAYQAANDQPVSVQATISPDAHIRFVGTNEAGRDAIKKYGIDS